jgi:intein-encoded DNA endonuclease-like protein
LGLHPNIARAQNLYRVTVRSVELYNKIQEAKKNLNPFLEDIECKKAFVRGFYESEGWNSVDIRGGWEIGMCNTNINLLKTVQNILSELGYNFKYRNRGAKAHEIRSRQKEQNYRFIMEIKPCIKCEVVNYERKSVG